MFCDTKSQVIGSQLGKAFLSATQSPTPWAGAVIIYKNFV